ncbi:MAG: glycosyltransferase family 4 protein [bacterium]|nr:glycosyltransferase family 4 protein [bacterium]
MKVLYLFAGERKSKFKGEIGIDYPDTQFYGLNHLKKYDIDAEFKEFDDLPAGGFFKKFLGFNARHALMFFLARRYDVVFGSSLLNMMVFKKIFRPKTKFVLLNISLIRVLKSNKGRFVKERLIKWLLRDIDAIVCLGSAQKEYLADKFGFLKNKVFFVPLGTDIVYYHPVYKGRKNFILSAGRDNGRDYKTVIRVAEKMPEENFEIVCSRRNLAGIGDIPPNIKIIYDIPIGELRKKYKEAKIMLLITHSNDYLDGADCSGQTVLLDSMSSGLPVVVSRKRCLLDYVEDGHSALLVDFYDVESILKKIRSLSNEEVRVGIAKNAREKTEDFFSTEKMAEKLADVFNVVVKKTNCHVA